MMKKPSSRLFKILYAGLFLGVILTGAVFSVVTAWRSLQSDADGKPFAQTISKALVDRFPGHNLFIDLYGGLMRMLGQRTCNAVVRLTDGRLIRESGYQDVTRIADALKEEAGHLLAKGIPFLFVPAPDGVDRHQRLLPRGIHAEANHCARDLMAKLREGGVDSLDLEDHLTDTPQSVSRYFYKTDHHWNCLAAREVAALVAERVCRKLGLDAPDCRAIFLDDRNWTSHTVKNAWLGRRGARVGRYFAGLDDFTWYTTTRKSRMSSYSGSKLLKSGDFNSVVISQEHLKFLGRYHEVTGAFGGTPSEVYGGGSGSCGELTFVNEDAPIDRRITVVRDSFGKSVAACLALAFREVVLLDPRNLPKDALLRNTVARTHPDMVVEIVSAEWAAAPIYRRIDDSGSYRWKFFKWKTGRP